MPMGSSTTVATAMTTAQMPDMSSMPASPSVTITP